MSYTSLKNSLVYSLLLSESKEYQWCLPISEAIFTKKISTISKIKYSDSLSSSFKMLPNGKNVPYRIKKKMNQGESIKQCEKMPGRYEFF